MFLNVIRWICINYCYKHAHTDLGSGEAEVGVIARGCGSIQWLNTCVFCIPIREPIEMLKWWWLCKRAKRNKHITVRRIDERVSLKKRGVKLFQEDEK